MWVLLLQPLLKERPSQPPQPERTVEHFEKLRPGLCSHRSGDPITLPGSHRDPKYQSYFFFRQISICFFRLPLCIIWIRLLIPYELYIIPPPHIHTSAASFPLDPLLILFPGRVSWATTTPKRESSPRLATSGSARTIRTHLWGSGWGGWGQL